jgi:hypothetical protein
MKLDEAKKRLRIDKHDLDEELIRQPELFFEVSERVTQAIAERDALKEELANVDAELDKEVRAKLTKNLERFTEAMVKNAIQTHKKHATAAENYLEAKNEADNWVALKEAFHQRRYMIQELCGLYLGNYFQRTAVSGSVTQEAGYSITREKLANRRASRDRSRID